MGRERLGDTKRQRERAGMSAKGIRMEKKQ